VNPWLLGGLACLLAWFVLTFLAPAGTGMVHVLLGAGLVAVVVWWGRRDAGGTAGGRQ